MSEETKTAPPLYYADGNTIWKRPIWTSNEDGSRSVTLGFPVCTMHEAVGEEGAIAAAGLLCRGETQPDLYAALERAVKALILERDGFYDSVTDTGGNVVEAPDGEILAEYDALIAACNTALNKARGKE